MKPSVPLLLARDAPASRCVCFTSTGGRQACRPAPVSTAATDSTWCGELYPSWTRGRIVSFVGEFPGDESGALLRGRAGDAPAAVAVAAAMDATAVAGPCCAVDGPQGAGGSLCVLVAGALRGAVGESVGEGALSRDCSPLACKRSRGRGTE